MDKELKIKDCYSNTNIGGFAWGLIVGILSGITLIKVLLL